MKPPAPAPTACRYSGWPPPTTTWMRSVTFQFWGRMVRCRNCLRRPRELPDAPVGTVTFGPEIEPVVEAAAGLLGDSEVTKFLREAYRPGENFGSAFARLFSRLFADGA